MSLCLLFVLTSSSAYALPIKVPNFATDPSGDQFTIEAIGPTEGASSNISAAPTLTYGVTDPITSTENTLQMTWDPIDEAQDAQAGWALVFGLDPDLTNQVLSLSIMPPANAGGAAGVGAMLRIEVRVVDIDHNLVGGWGFNTDQGNWIIPGGVAGAPLLANDFAAAGQWPPTPPAIAANPNMQSNWWNHISVTPEPATIVLLGLGGLLLRRRKR